MKRSKRISIVEPNIFVSQDIRDTLTAAMPDSQCDVFESLGAVRSAIVSIEDEPDLLVVSADRNGQVTGTNEDVMWLFGLRVIVIDPMMAQMPEGWAYLSKPFSEEQLIDVAQHLLSGCKHDAYDAS